MFDYMQQSFTAFELIIVGAMGLAIVLLLIILILLAARRPIRTGDLPNALSESWIKLGLGEKMGNLEAEAKSMLEAHGSVEKSREILTSVPGSRPCSRMTSIIRF